MARTVRDTARKSKRMMIQLILPGVLVAINVGEAVVCFFCGDWKKGVYFLASAVCIGMVAVK